MELWGVKSLSTPESQLFISPGPQGSLRLCLPRRGLCLKTRWSIHDRHYTRHFWKSLILSHLESSTLDPLKGQKACLNSLLSRPPSAFSIISIIRASQQTKLALVTLVSPLFEAKTERIYVHFIWNTPEGPSSRLNGALPDQLIKSLGTLQIDHSEELILRTEFIELPLYTI